MSNQDQTARRNQTAQGNPSRLFSLLLAALLAVSAFHLPPASAAEGAGDAGDAGANGVNRAVSFTVRTINEGLREDGQRVEATIFFERPIRVLAGAEAELSVRIAGGSLDEAPNTEDGKSNRTLSALAGEDGASLIVRVASVPGAAFVKHTNARLEIAAAGLSRVLDAASGTPVRLGYIDCVIPSGLRLRAEESVTGSALAGAARVSKRVDGLSNIRTMIYIQALVNGEALFPDQGDGRRGSYVVHAHLFTSMRAEDYASSIAAGFASAARKAGDLADRYEMRAEGDRITLRALRPREGEVLDFRVFEWPVDGSALAETPPDPGTAEGAGFADVAGWEKEYVEYLRERGIVEGRPAADGVGGANGGAGEDAAAGPRFDPGALVTRAEVLKMLARLAEAEPGRYAPSGFPDVPGDAWYAPSAAWAEAEGLITGISGNLRPDDPILRQDLALMLARFSEKTRGEGLPAMEAREHFSDHERIAPYALDAVYALQEAGLAEANVNGQFLPQSGFTRGQCAKILTLYMQITDQSPTKPRADS
jgi:hypothetical protein